MSDLDTLSDIYDVTCALPGSPCHPNQSKVRRKFSLMQRAMLRRRSRLVDHRGAKKKAPVSLAKLNLPDLPAE